MIPHDFHAYQRLHYVEASGFDNGMWYGGFCSLFYREDDHQERSRLNDISFSEGHLRVPFLLVIGEMTVSVPKQLQLLNGATWNGGLPYKAWLAVDVLLHPWPPGDSDWPIAQRVREQERQLATVCDGIALAVQYPHLLEEHYAIGCYGSSQQRAYQAPYIHAAPLDIPPYEYLPRDRPNLFQHSVGPNTFNGGGGAVLSYSHVISLESVMQESFQRYTRLCDRSRT